MTYKINDRFTLYGSQYEVIGLSEKWYKVKTIKGFKKNRLYKPVVDLTAVEGLKDVIAAPLNGKKIGITIHKDNINVEYINKKENKKENNGMYLIGAAIGLILVLKVLKK